MVSVPALDPTIRDPLWDLRRASMPLLYGLPGLAKPVTFVEDCAVAPERLPEHVIPFGALRAGHTCTVCMLAQFGESRPVDHAAPPP